MRLGVDGFKIKGIIYLTSSPTPQCRLGCLLICGKCRAAFRRVACCASALSSHAAPWGHFASLVRSASPARLPSASLRRISRQSRDCLRVRVLHSCTPSSRRQPCFPAFPAVARGALSLRFARSARHLAVTSLRSCARLRLRGYPLLRFGAFTLGCSSAVRCVLHSRMHAAWLGVEYHILRQSAHLRGALRIPSLERSRVSCRASPCSVALSVATFPIYYCGASCAL